MLSRSIRHVLPMQRRVRYVSFFDRLFSGDETVEESPMAFGSSEYHLALLGFVSMTMHPKYSLQNILRDDPDFLMGHVLVGTSQYLSPQLHEDSIASLSKLNIAKDILSRVESSTLEKWHVKALECMVTGKFRTAATIYEAILRQDYSDMLALKCAIELYDILGDKTNKLNAVSRVLPLWSASQPGYSHLLSLQAYGVTENGDHGAAHTLADRAMAMNEEDAGALHALLHVNEVQGKHQDGASILLRSTDSWETFEVLRTHIHAHHALYLIETGRFNRVEKLLRNEIFQGDKTISAKVLIDATQIYWRLVLAGFDAPWVLAELQKQWQVVLSSKEVALTPLAAIHAYTVLSQISLSFDFGSIGLGDENWNTSQVATLLQKDIIFFSYPVSGYKELLQNTFDAIKAYNEQQYQEAANLFLQIRSQIHLLGGSKVEHELYDMLLIDAATRGRDYSLAHLILNERINAKPQSAQYWHTFATVMEGLGDDDAVQGARQMSYVLGLGQAGHGAA
ncbi:DNA polymerase epsilon subunit [Thraustotheca clavata]|uniref:Tetratricopeptide repeat protein 38 n=1 Tax=Thraustotheca clavata TaxID=74557 RepID=A0A1V9ZHB0_9STRA|nr:DNA polymerase epsilon subunit [Thraustotheca clavata]